MGRAWSVGQEEGSMIEPLIAACLLSAFILLVILLLAEGSR